MNREMETCFPVTVREMWNIIRLLALAKCYGSFRFRADNDGCIYINIVSKWGMGGCLVDRNAFVRVCQEFIYPYYMTEKYPIWIEILFWCGSTAVDAGVVVTSAPVMGDFTAIQPYIRNPYVCGIDVCRMSCQYYFGDYGFNERCHIRWHVWCPGPDSMVRIDTYIYIYYGQ